MRRDNLGRASIVAFALLVLWPLSAPEHMILSASEENALLFATNQVDPANLDASIDKVLERREFGTGFPRLEMLLVIC